MSRPLFEECPLCDGVGTIDREGGRIECPGCCKGFVQIGLTAGQVERIVAENDRLKALHQAPFAIVIVPIQGQGLVEVHACDLPHRAIELSRRLTAEGRAHTVHRVHAYRVHTYKGEVT